MCQPIPKIIGLIIRCAPQTLSKRMVWAGLVACFLLPGASHSLGSQYPEPLRNKAEIAKAPAETDDIDIRDLPIEAFSDLKKFPQLKRVRFGNREGKGATDAKLEALANLALTNVFDVNLLNCPNVTD